MPTLYLSPRGCDSWSGRISEPLADLSDGPLASPGAMQLLARRLASGTRDSIRVIVAGGDYELAEPLVFTPADSGQVWMAAPGERPVLSGGRSLSGWIVGEHRGQVCWSLDLPEVRRGDWIFTQLWVNGERRTRTRLPKSGFYRFTGMDGQPNSGFSFFHGPVRAEYRPEDIRAFHNIEEVSLVAYQLWFETHHRIKSLDEAAHVVEFQQPSLGSLLDETGEFARYALFHVFEGLSEPGEWYLDRIAGRLYYLPLPGELPEQTRVVAPRLAELVRFQSSSDAAVADVRLENLVFSHNEWSRSRDNVGAVQAAADVPGAVVFDRSERCVLYGCEIAHCAGYGIEMLSGSHANIVAACTIHDLGGGGVKICHESLSVHEPAVGEDFVPEARWFRRMAATVADCRIHDGGHVYPSAIGIWIGNAGENRIQHNEIAYFAYTGISFGWVWGYDPSSRGFDNRIENNHIHHINHERLLSDNGGIYSLGLQPGSVVAGNHIHEISCHGYGGWGLYPDEGSSGILYRDNAVHDVTECGLCVHYGRFLTVRNNLFVRMGRDILGLGREEMSCGNVFEGNVLWFDQGNLGERADRAALTHATRRNLIWKDSPGGVSWPLGSLEAEQTAGRWIDTIEADPLFSDPRGGDLTLRADSPALAMGFEPFDWRQAGPRPLRPSAYDDYQLPMAEPIAAAVARVDAPKIVPDDSGYRVDATIVVNNPSRLSVSGEYRIVAKAGGPPVREWLIGQVPVSLAPGEEVSLPISFPFQPDVKQVWLMALGDEQALFSGAVLVRIPSEVEIPNLPVLPDREISRSLDAGKAFEIVHGGLPVLTARVAVAGDRLLLKAEIAEPHPHPDDLHPYNASSVELFLAPDIDGTVKSKPSQFFLMPPGDGVAGKIRSSSGATPECTAFDVRLTPEGWSFEMAIPLGPLGIATPVQAFRFDLICNMTSPVAGQNLLHLPVWGMGSNHTDAGLLARVTVAP